MGVKHMQGIPWHIEYLNRCVQEKTESKHSKSKCVFYFKKENACRMLGSCCYGVRYCTSYSEKAIALRKIFPKTDEKELYDLLTPLAKEIRIQVAAIQKDPASWISKKIVAALDEICRLLKDETVHGTGGDARYLVSAALSMPKLIERVDQQNIFPYVLDVLWLKANKLHYTDNKIIQAKNSTIKENDDIASLFVYTVLLQTIMEHSPTAFLIAYSKNFQNYDNKPHTML